MEDREIKKAVRERYSNLALRFLSGRPGSCCGPAACCDPAAPENPARDASALGVDMGREAYDRSALEEAPSGAASASLGCGDPVALADLRPGEDVLDLGCGGGLDVALAARRVGADGRVYGLDQSEEMLALAGKHLSTAGVRNAILLRGDIEAIPLPRASVDVILSNCVINLSTDKAAALGEAFRVLRPGGRLAVSDMVFTRPLPAWAERHRRDLAAWSGCAAGALTVDEYRERLAAAGFTDIRVDVRAAFPCPEESPWGTRFTPEEQREFDGLLAAASIRARKPGPGA